MPEACGVSWSGTSGGKLDESAIPDPPEHSSHYLNAAETKGDSSFPVVDGEGNLRAGNVNSAWDMRGRGEGVSEECLRKLADAFEEDPLPESANENSMSISLQEYDEDAAFGINLEYSVVPKEALSEGFNRHGVRENDDGSLDVRFNAMEPGVRRGIEITPEFLRSVAGGVDGRIPLQLDHSKNQLKNAGYIEAGNIQFGGEFLQVQAHIPNTGSSVRNDVIADFSHDPPQVTDISISFDPRSVEVDTSGDKPQFVSGDIREFSLTPFPAGYDDGGLTPEFSAAVEQTVIDSECEPCASPEEETVRSYLVSRPHVLIRK